MGLQFANPVGLAAGLDKNGDYIDALAELGRAEGPEQVLAITEQLLTTLSASPGAAEKFGAEIRS